MTMRKITLPVLFLLAMVGCGGSKDKAKELIEVSGLTKYYSTIVDSASIGYASRYPMLEREQIRKVVREKIGQDKWKSKMVDIYADHFNADELELMIRANKHPEQAMAIILSSKEGRALAEKVMRVQSDVAQDMQEAMVDSDKAIIDALDDLKDELKG